MGESQNVIAWEELPDRPKLGNYVGEVGIPPEMFTEGFLSAHPDLRWRREGLHSFSNRQYTIAMNQFKRSARYGDKPSQAMVAEMYWEGLGVEQDRPLAYAWMDIAAERMYPNFVILRERYWHRLDEKERIDAVERGQTVLAAVGDEVAKPRMERVLNRQRRKITGSRTGFVGNLSVIELTGPAAAVMDLSSLRSGHVSGGRDGVHVYADKYWVPEHYWELQDEIWRAPVRRPEVKVGELDPVRSGDAD